jgi:hypothetical protein
MRKCKSVQEQAHQEDSRRSVRVEWNLEGSQVLVEEPKENREVSGSTRDSFPPDTLLRAAVFVGSRTSNRLLRMIGGGEQENREEENRQRIVGRGSMLEMALFRGMRRTPGSLVDNEPLLMRIER